MSTFIGVTDTNLPLAFCHSSPKMSLWTAGKRSKTLHWSPVYYFPAAITFLQCPKLEPASRQPSLSYGESRLW